MSVDQLSEYNPDGTTLGQDASDKIGFFGATPIVRPAAPTDAASIITALQNLGLVST